jgi:phosphohistidine phosphatase SixA
MRGLGLKTIALSVTLLSLAALPPANMVRADDLEGASLVQHLRDGGYVLLLRHAHAPASPPSKEIADQSNLTLERQLDEQGRDSAKAMGKAIKKLRIPIGLVLSSPTYRAMETVRLAGLGTAQPTAQLGDGGQSMARDAVSGQASWLRSTVASQPKPGSNTLLVTHMPNIQTAFPDDAADLSDGEMLVFRPDKAGGAKLVAKIKIEDWPGLADHQG